ncbi:hypothetical protein OS493_027336 [Desmophyllum pertusum]|uniref:G-protein coupled receptors family 1 profile domain-containing protein n=1 Tax=Desmophyllum pertusum TaxID=174260 RepID=A0A9W9YXC5_9CNID|nr:hypothetical protein OS493_027336 [Desmophyllum pertusum]
MLGNGFVLAVIARFKSLRTVPNILIANLAVVDLLNSAVNLPLHLITILEASWYRGKTLGIMNSFLNRLFVALNLVSMLAMMANTYLAIAFDFKYFIWKTKKKALVCVFLIWLFQYRDESRDELTFTPSSSSTTKRHPSEQNHRHYNNCLLPLLYSYHRVCSGAGLQKETQSGNWFGFIAWYSLYFSSAVNPIIYYLRTKRFRSAFKQFLKDPLGSSDFKEKPNGRGNGKRWNVELMARKVNGARGDGREAWEVERDAQQRRHTYSERRNALVILSTENTEAHPCVHQEDEVRSEYERTKEQSGEARALKIQVQNQCERNEKETEEGNEEEVPKKRTLEMVSSGKQLLSSSRPKVYPLGVTEMYNTRGSR